MTCSNLNDEIIEINNEDEQNEMDDSEINEFEGTDYDYNYSIHYNIMCDAHYDPIPAPTVTFPKPCDPTITMFHEAGCWKDKEPLPEQTSYNIMASTMTISIGLLLSIAGKKVCIDGSCQFNWIVALICALFNLWLAANFEHDLGSNWSFAIETVFAALFPILFGTCA